MIRSSAAIFALVAMSFGTTVRAQDVRRAEAAPDRARAELVSRLKAEAAKTDTAKLSELFSALSNPKMRAELHLSAEQTDLASRLEKLTRDIIKAWLLRDLDANQLPPSAVLAERLSQPGERLRSRLVAHAEAIALQGVLTTKQDQLLYRAMGRKPEPLLRGRDGPDGTLLAAADEKRPVVELAEDLRYKATTRDRAGDTLYVLLGRAGRRGLYPKGIGHLDPLQQKLARQVLPKVDLPMEQLDLAEQLDQLTLAIWKSWLTRDLNKVPLPPQPVLAQRLWEGGERVRESLFAHSEAIALEGILTPDQSERALRALWELRGMRALLDPVLASRLRLTRAQREEVQTFLDAERRVREEATYTPVAPRALLAAQPQLRLQLLEQKGQVIRARLAELDGAIWDVLTPSQARILGQILSGTTRPPRRPAAQQERPKNPG